MQNTYTTQIQLNKETILQDLATQQKALTVVKAVIIISIFVYGFTASIFSGSPVLIIFLVLAMVFGNKVMNKISGNLSGALQDIRKNNYQLIEDVVIDARIETNETHENSTTKYYFQGYRCSSFVPGLNNASIWQYLKRGDTVWVLKTTGKNENYVKIYPASRYIPADEIRMQTKPLTKEDKEYALEKAIRNAAIAKPDNTGMLNVVIHNEDNDDGNAANDRPEVIQNLFTPSQSSSNIIICKSCGKRFDKIKHGGTCPRCGSMQL